MTIDDMSRRHFLKVVGTATSAGLFDSAIALAPQAGAPSSAVSEKGSADYTLRIGAAPIEIAPKRIVSTITYNGLSLLEGRIMLVVGLLVIALSGAALARRPHRLLGPALAACGGLGVVVMAFAAISHPVELATLFRSYSQIDAVKVSLPNGAGIWLAVVGALLILAGGLLVVLLGRERQGEEQE